MLDLVHAPARSVTRHEQAVQLGTRTTAGEWACAIVPDPPSAVLLVERRCASPARDVHVLLDGQPAKDHSTVYVDATVPEIDDRGRRRACLCDRADDAFGP